MKKLSYIFCAFLAICLLSLSLQSTAQPKVPNDHPGNFYTVNKDFKNSNVDGYNVYVPKSCTEASKPYPLIVFFQGGLGVGGDVDAIFNWELPKELVEANGAGSELYDLKLNTFIYVMPHITKGQFYENTAAIGQVIDEVCGKYNIDKKKIYLTGLSRGGHGSWGVACRIPERFAAVVPISGAPHGIDNYKNLTNIAILAAHNEADEVVDFAGTNDTVEKIEELSEKVFVRSGSLAEVDIKNHDWIFISGENPQKPHDAWTAIYNEVNFYKWLLRFELK